MTRPIIWEAVDHSPSFSCGKWTLNGQDFSLIGRKAPKTCRLQQKTLAPEGSISRVPIQFALNNSKKTQNLGCIGYNVPVSGFL